MFEDKKVMITGGTGSLGNVLTERLLKEENPPNKIIIFSRDEAKQHAMRLKFMHKEVATEEVTYSNFKQRVQFIMGDIRDYHSIRQAIRGVDIIFHAAAVKQVPTAEYFPVQAIKTNILGSENLINAIIESNEPVSAVIGASSDKACYPINAYGMTKALMERLFIAANLKIKHTRFLLTRYGNVMGSTGSVLPLFKNQIENNKPLTVTSEEMTRYMMDIQQSVDLLFNAYKHGKAGEIFVPTIPSAKMIDVARLMAAPTKTKIKVTGIRPGEKIHETLISEQEMPFTELREGQYVIHPMLPELGGQPRYGTPNMRSYTSQHQILDEDKLKTLLKGQGYL